MRRQFANASRVLGSWLGVKSRPAIAALIVSVFEAKKRFRLRALDSAVNNNPRENYGIRLLLPDFLAFCLVHFAQARLNTTRQILTCDRRAVAPGAQLGPGDLRMDAAIEHYYF